MLSRLVGVALCVALLGASAAARAQSGSGPTDPEKLYADLDKLPQAEREKRLEDGARKEGELSLIQTLRGQVGRGSTALFHKRYPFLKLDATEDIGSQDAAERLYAEEAAQRPLTDVISVAKADLVNLLKSNDVAPYHTPAVNVILPQYKRFIDPQGRWTPYYWSEHGISYNTNLVPPDKAPKQWSDLCNPFFKGSVSFDPAEIRFLAGLYDILGEAGTKHLLECIGKNDPIIQRGHSQRIQLMLAGDHMVQGDNYLYYGEFLKRKNPSLPYGMVLSAPLIASAGVAVINRHAAHPYAAALYVDWLLSPESQKWMAKEFRGPITMKHPFLPDNVKLVDENNPPPDVAKRILGYWYQFVEKKKR